MGQSQRHSMPSNAKCRPHASYTICTEARYLRGLGPIYQESPPIMGVWAERSALGLVIVVRCVFVDGGIGGGACVAPRALRGSAENRQGYHGAGPRQMHVGNRLASAARHLSVAGRNTLIRGESAASFEPVEHCGRHPARAATRCRRLTARATSQATPPVAVACPCHTRHSSYGLVPTSLSPSAGTNPSRQFVPP